MTKLSLMLNLVVLVPVCFGLITHAHWAEESYGNASDARSILLAIYLAIGLASCILLIFPKPQWIAALLAIQILYKLMTPLTVGALLHPVVLSNIGIAIFHSLTLFLMWHDGLIQP